MSTQGTEKVGNIILMAGTVLTLILAAGVILGVHRSSMPSSPYQKIDPAGIQRLIRKGKISGRKAEHFEEMKSP